MSWDLKITESGNGGDLVRSGRDLAVVNGIDNMPYLAMFGGNTEQSTSTNKVADSKDFWGNDLLMKSDFSIQFNSTIERILNTTPLTSAGRIIIENAIKKDLEFLSPETTIEVTVTIVSTDRIDVIIKLSTDIKTEKIIVINFRKTSDGDWSILDFNNDFFL